MSSRTPNGPRSARRSLLRGPVLMPAALLFAAASIGGVLYYRSGIPEYTLPVLPPAHSQASHPALGPLRVLKSNQRYFTDGSGRAVLLAGAHTWSNLQDNGLGDPPPRFDYEAFLDFLVANHLNFFRLWCWEQARWAPWVDSGDYYFFPGPPYERTGPGMALDGKPRFDLGRFNAAYFERLRERVSRAGERGVYVSVMLFNGWAIDDEHSHLKRGNPWRGHPYNRANNVNGVDGDPNRNNGGEETHELLAPAGHGVSGRIRTPGDRCRERVR